MELKKNLMQCYRQILDLALSQEETHEAIVPDARPDILRIISVCGQVCINEKTVVEDHLQISGHIETSVLYLPEEGEEVQNITVKIPFLCQNPAQPLVEGDDIFVIPSVYHAEARILNPRKILLRAELLLEVSGYQRNDLALSYSVEQSDSEGIEELVIAQEIHPLCAVESKHFTFDETITLQGQEDLEELLSIRLYPLCQESKLIGNKLIFKGDTEVQLLYLNTAGELEQSHHLLPFSQIMEIQDCGEEADCQVSILVESFYPAEGGGRTVNLTLDFIAQATVRGEKQLSLLEDIYSTQYHLSVEKEDHTLVTVAEDYAVAQNIRQIFETSMPVQGIADTWVSCGKVAVQREGNIASFSCDLLLSILCCDETGAWNTMEFTHSLQHQIDCPEDILCRCRCISTGEVFATPAPGGIELRLSPQFLYSLVETESVHIVATAVLGEARDRGTSSVVLRLPQEKESLWDIAKNYGSTVTQIKKANCLEEDTLPLGQMLLIPSIR